MVRLPIRICNARQPINYSLQGSTFSGVQMNVTDMPVERLIPYHAANAADLILVGRLDVHADPAQFGLVNPGDLLIAAGRPLMVIPDKLEKLEAKNILVAWKNTREARRAVADALPLLSAAESVSLVQIRETGAETDSVNDVHQFLSAHGVKSRITIQNLDQEPADAHLIRLARESRSDIIVAGAYGRSRLHEWAFGGVTRGLLKQNSVACQLSH
jgi:nucleotide-binding universal stress UspA family protein